MAEDRDVRRLRALFDECLLLACLEQGRPGRSADAWLGMCARVQAALAGRDPGVDAIMADLGEVTISAARTRETHFYALQRIVLPAREDRFYRMAKALEADGTLPHAASPGRRGGKAA